MLRGTIDISKFGKNGRESYSQLCRSFNRNFISLLYSAFAQVNYNLTDIDGISRTCEIDRDRPLLGVTQPALHLPFTGQDMVGVQVGSSDAVAGPLDIDLGNRILHADAAPEAVNVVMEGVRFTGSISIRYVYSANWAMQTLHVPWPVNAYAVRLYCYRAGDLSARTLTASIRKTDGSWNPTGSDLAVGTATGAQLHGITTDTNGQWFEVALTSPYVLRPYTRYCIIVRLDGGDSSNSLRWQYGGSGSSSGYRLYRYGADCTGSSSNSGTSWSLSDSYHQSQYFLVMGRHPIGLCHYPTTVRTISFPTPPPDMQFTIERLFHNFSGSAITLRETGLYASAPTSASYENFVYLIARDVLVAPITVNNDELLKVSYAVQISV
jgi:hypothetical protein